MTNTTGHSLDIVGGYIWVGEQMLGRSDTAIQLIDMGTGAYIWNTNDDHYADRTCMDCSNHELNLPAGTAYEWPNGDTLRLAYQCYGPYTDNPTGAQGQFSVRTVRDGRP